MFVVEQSSTSAAEVIRRRAVRPRARGGLEVKLAARHVVVLGASQQQDVGGDPPGHRPPASAELRQRDRTQFLTSYVDRPVHESVHELGLTGPLEPRAR